MSLPIRYRAAFAFLLPVLVYVACSAWFVHGGAFDSFPLDDAWIHRVYARALATGHGFAYNDGAQEAGFTSPLWVIATAPVHWLVSDVPHAVVVATMIGGVFFGALSILALAGIARFASGSLALAAVTATLFAVEPRLLFASLSGMETPLLVALWLWGTLACLARRWNAAAVLFGLAAITRPEFLCVLPVCVGVMLVAGRDASWRRKLFVVVLPWVPFAAWSLFCRTTMSHWLPTTYYLKSHSFHLTAAALGASWRVVSEQGFAAGFLFPVGIVAGLVFLVRERTIAAGMLVIVSPLVYLAGVVGTRDVHTGGYYWTRWLDPVSLMLTAAFAFGLAVLLCGGAGALRPSQRNRRVLIGSVAVLLTAASAPGLGRSLRDVRARLQSDANAIYTMNVVPGRWIDENVPREAVVGVKDAGAMRYFGRRYTIDLLGLNYSALAFGHTSPAQILERCDWLVISPASFRPAWPRISAEFERVAAFEMAREAYTVCNCPGQAEAVAMRTRRTNP